jgi:hypothetical protein
MVNGYLILACLVCEMKCVGPSTFLSFLEYEISSLNKNWVTQDKIRDRVIEQAILELGASSNQTLYMDAIVPSTYP